MKYPAPVDLSTDRRTDPFAVGTPHPEFAWRLQSPGGQTGYGLQVATGADFATPEIVWDSGLIASDIPFGIAYAGEPLQSRTRYYWRVRIRTHDGQPTRWSEIATFETAILEPHEWTARWITAPRRKRTDTRTLYFSVKTELSAPIARARAYVSALGWYRLFVNSTDQTGHALVPRWTPFHHYVEYQTYDITTALTQGANTIGIVVADGRYRGTLGLISRRARYGNRLAALAQLEIELADGTAITMNSDDSWHVGEGRILRSDPKTGERVDLRISDKDWLTPTGATLRETRAEILTATKPTLIADDVNPVTLIDRRSGTITTTRAGAQIIDFGQNFAGVARVRLDGPAGTFVKLEYGEVLTPDGDLDTDYLPSGRDGWFQRDEAILAGRPIDYTPWFTIHGFRYVSITGLPQSLTTSDVEGLVLSTDLAPTAEFEVSDPALQQLWHNARWSLRSNFLDTPTDCPTRERSGWTGDIQIFGPTAIQMVDSDFYLRRYLRNVAAEQSAKGTVPPVIPAEDSPGRSRNPLRTTSTSVGWGDVTVMLPWTLYWYTGDITVLRDQYASAKLWVDQLERRAAKRKRFSRRLRGTGTHERYIVDTGYHWGEWLRPGASMVREIIHNTMFPNASIATAYFTHSASLLTRIAETLEEPSEAIHYGELADHARSAWQAAFVRDGGARIGGDLQDDYVRALAFDLLDDPDQRTRATHRLVELITAADFHLGTGFLSTPMLLSTLTDAGHSELAYRLLLQNTPPSWLAQIARGATTIWETWEGYGKNGRAHHSHNHYAFGAVAQFLHERVAGLAPAEPGYRRIRVAPIIGGGLTAASIQVMTPYGQATSAWQLDSGIVRLEISTPPGTTTDVQLGNRTMTVDAGKHEFIEHLGSGVADELA
ncbi:MAG: alpha-L-rhamnosidase [Nocardia sp.]|uniref:alpha-L-rhamnosidase n=1 Tax=Nocardia sp. TaxID=1821 RepID=UPI002625C8D6|nr:alpha-L-rhamnosidase [Nocardia sp.]MCU1645020.1 alpha-L-rhamnosidase [Nocardia sp.]